jgi:hypothetical protein
VVLADFDLVKVDVARFFLIRWILFKVKNMPALINGFKIKEKNASSLECMLHNPNQIGN